MTTSKDANGQVVELPPAMTDEEKAAARDRAGDFHRRINDLYDIIDSAEDGRSDGYLTFAELRHFFQGNAEKALHYISQIDGYADNSGFIDIFEFNAFFDFYGGENSKEAVEMLETLEAEAAAFKAARPENITRPEGGSASGTKVVRTQKTEDQSKPREPQWDKRVRKMYEWLNAQIGRKHGSRVSYDQCKDFFSGKAGVATDDSVRFPFGFLSWLEEQAAAVAHEFTISILDFRRYFESLGGEAHEDAQDALHILEGWRINKTARELSRKKKKKKKNHHKHYK